MPRVLLLAATTGYQTRAFSDAAERLGVDLLYATDRCNVLPDPWRDDAVPIRFADDIGSAMAILEAVRRLPIDGILAVGDRPTVIAARVGEALGIPGHPFEAATASRNKRLTRECLLAANLPVPWFFTCPITVEARTLVPSITFPCIVKPLALSGSRGVMRVNDDAELVAAFYRLRTLLQAPDLRGDEGGAHDLVLIEAFIPGREYAVEGLMSQGTLQVLALFDKPDPLDGPFFEETIYLTPSVAPPPVQQHVVDAVFRAAQALGLRHGPIHAECRLNDTGVFVLEVAARPIGGLCARALRFTATGSGGPFATLEELLLRHALGESTRRWACDASASGVMMIPIPRRGVLRRVSGIDAARRVPGIEDVRITAKPDQILIPLPEGASYLGFIFARALTPGQVEHALRSAHALLRFEIEREVRVLQSLHG